MKNFLVKILGSYGAALHGDAAVLDRWHWLNRNFKISNGKVLDAGCGSGAFTFFAAKRGNYSVGISFQERNNEAARERARVLGLKNTKFVTGYLKDIKTTVGELGPFDAAICFETIEHVMEDRKLIKDISELLKLGGLLFLTTPYKYHKGYEKEQVSPIENGDHVRHGYTHEEMGEIMEKGGLRVTKKEYLSGYVSQQLMFLHRKLGDVLKSDILPWLIVTPLKVLRIFDRPISRILKYPHMCIAVIGEKK